MDLPPIPYHGWVVRPWLNPYLRDAALALVLVVVTLLNSLDLYFSGAAQRKQVLPYFDDVANLDRALVIWWVFGAALVASLLIMHRWPMVALAFAGIGGIGHQLDPRFAVQPLDLAVPCVLYVVASSVKARWVSGAVLSAAVVAAYAVRVRDELTGNGKLTLPGAQAPIANESFGMALERAAIGSFDVLLVLVLAVAIGDGVRSRRANVRMLELRAADLERAQQQQAELAAGAERSRISREMHDVVAHSLSVIVAQAQGAEAALAHHPDRAATALAHVIEAGRASLAEMRRLLGVIRRDPTDTEPGVAGLPALVEQMRTTGLVVLLSQEGTPVPLPAGVGLSVYRIVQEALTNTLKHAGAGTNVLIRLVFAGGEVHVDVTDDGRRGAAAAPPALNGYGLRGIAERVTLLGGDVAVGPVGTAGFRVSARLPIPMAREADS